MPKYLVKSIEEIKPSNFEVLNKWTELLPHVERQILHKNSSTYVSPTNLSSEILLKYNKGQQLILD